MYFPRATRTARLLGVALALALSAAVGVAAAEPTAEEKAGARAAATEASAAYEQKRFAEALDLLQRAESLVHAPTHILMIARCQVALGQLVTGRESYMALSREALAPGAPQAFKDAQTDGKRELGVLEPRVPTINVKVSDLAAQNVVITMDGAVVPPALVGIARPVDPGSHRLQAQGDGLVSNETKVEIAEGQKFELVLDLRPSGAKPVARSGDGSPPPGEDEAGTGTMTYVGFGGIGLGAAGVGVGVLFLALGGSARSDADDAYAACAKDTCFAGSPRAQNAIDFDDDASTKQTIGVISLIAGGALAAGGVTLLLLDMDGSSTEEASITPWVGLGSAGARGRF